MSKPTQFKSKLVTPRTLAAATTLTYGDSGKTLFLNLAGGFTVTLPKVKAGLEFDFVVKTAPSGANYIINTSDGQPTMYGQVYTTDINSATDPDFNIVAASRFNFVDAVAVVGDSMRMISDGTYWYIRAFCSVYNAETITLSQSVSPSVSVSISPSASPSVSVSISPSVSVSVSPSVSPSVSVSRSPSVSVSISPSTSPSVSVSISPSVSVSISPSVSPSVSVSISPSVSRSASPS